ncbi:hypothetical protein GCM10017771_78360 [Streptomyces capitiformicae]|uniref:Uncharacterized protein n=1 Tax=Streptomyces capitiformicae TaxID=2014920 RepID=A0A918ZJ53_9ACTN|nr:hypothetical protein GCM10017771_78360 [Streptomyces capitiformicae]
MTVHVGDPQPHGYVPFAGERIAPPGADRSASRAERPVLLVRAEAAREYRTDAFGSGLGTTAYRDVVLGLDGTSSRVSTWPRRPWSAGPPRVRRTLPATPPRWSSDAEYAGPHSFRTPVP